jgi:hypothetical protein
MGVDIVRLLAGGKRSSQVGYLRPTEFFTALFPLLG